MTRRHFFRSLVVWLVHSRLDYGNFVFVGLPAYLQRRLQAVLNAAARLVFRLRRYDHVTDALAILHWLRLPERVNFKLALMAYRVLNAPESTRSGIKPARPSPFTVVIHTTAACPAVYSLSTVGRRSFSVAASTFWNTLPNDIQSAPSLSSFRRQLKTFLFHQSFPDIIL